MYLAISADMNQADLIGRAPQLIKICSADAARHLVQQSPARSPPGACAYAPVRHSDQDELSVLRLKPERGAAWEAVLQTRNLAAYVPGDFPNPQMELIVVLPQPV